jgi:hypothetical protein
MEIYFVPPHTHRVNVTKRAIAAFKEHFIVALTTVDRNCLLQLWNNFLPQVELTLNLLQFSRWDPTKSANKEVNRKFDYNKMPLAPLGTKRLVYNDPEIHASWAPHSTNAYYLGLALGHYQCLQFYMPGTSIRGYQVPETWRLYQTHSATPTMSQAEQRRILQTMDTLTALGGTVPTCTSASIARTQAIQKLCEILLPTLHQGTTNPLATDTPSPRVLY